MAKISFSENEKQLIETLLNINESKNGKALLKSNDSHLSFQKILIICANAWKREPNSFLGAINMRSQFDRCKKSSLLFALYFFSDLEPYEVARQLGWNCTDFLFNCPYWFKHLVAESNRYAGIQAKIICLLDKACPQRLGLSTANHLDRDRGAMPLACLPCNHRRGCPYGKSYGYRMTNCPIIKLGIETGMLIEISGHRSDVRMPERLYKLIKGLETSKDETTVN